MPFPVQFEVISGSGRSHHDFEQGHSDEIMYLVPWASRFTFCAAMAGQAHPTLPQCWARAFDCEPFFGEQTRIAAQITDPLTELPAYTKDNNGFTALVHVYYSRGSLSKDASSGYNWPCDIDKPSYSEGTELTIRGKSSGQFLRLPSGAVRWTDNTAGAAGGPMPDPDADESRIYVTGREMQIDWLFVDEPPLDTWDQTYVGRVNDAEFLGVPAECLLFENYDFEPSTSLDWTSSACWTLRTIWRMRIIGKDGDTYLGWNHEYRNDGIKRVKVKDASGSWVNRYQTVDFTDVFTESTCPSSSSGS